MPQMTAQNITNSNSNNNTTSTSTNNDNNYIHNNNVDDLLEIENLAAKKILNDIGLELIHWQPKPGRARHMGIAKYNSHKI